MSGWRALLVSPWVVGLGWMVVVSLLTTTIPALALGVWRLLRPQAGALDQYRAAAIALVSAIVLSVSAGPLLLLTTTAANASALEAPVPAASAGRPGSRSRPAAEPAPTPGAAPPAATTVGRARIIGTLPAIVVGSIGLGWLVGIGLLTARLAHGVRAVMRLERQATLIDEGPLRETFEGLSATVGLEGTRLLLSADVDAPVAVGVRQPAVILPVHLLDILPGDGLTSILLHELAHVRRGDYGRNLAQAGAEVLLFHSPAVWWMGGRIREAREFHCDDVSADAAGDRTRYVEALTLVARLGPLQHARPAVGMAGPRLVTRVRRLLEREPTMSMPFARTVLLSTVAIMTSAALPPVFDIASAQLSAHRIAAGRAMRGDAVPYGFPQRQDGSALRIIRVSSTDEHVCGAFEVQNTSTMPVARVRFVGILSFSRAARRPVQIVESDWVAQPLAPGASARMNAGLVDVNRAWDEARGEHVQAFCAVRELTYADGTTWGVVPNAGAMQGSEAMEPSHPTLPAAFVGQTHVLAAARRSLCVDDKGAEYSGGAQIAIRDEPGRAARCTPDGQWVEVAPRSGEPLAPRASQGVAMEVVVDGVPATIRLTSAAGAVATVTLPGGRILGFVPTVAANGEVSVALHEMTTAPHRLVGNRSLQPGAAARFEDGPMTLSVTLVEQ